MEIGKDWWFISGVDLGLLLLVGTFCPTVGGVSLHLQCIVLLWSVSLKVWIYLSEFLSLWLLGRTEWYLISMVVMDFFNAVDASLSIVWNPGLIPRILNLFSMMWKHVSYTCHFYSSLDFSEWRCNSIHTWRRCIYFLYWMWLGSVRINWSKIYLLVLYFGTG